MVCTTAGGDAVFDVVQAAHETTAAPVAAKAIPRLAILIRVVTLIYKSPVMSLREKPKGLRGRLRLERRGWPVVVNRKP